MTEPDEDEIVDLLQQLIRNRCVNDGSPGSGQEAASVSLLESLLEEAGAETERFEPVPGRASLVARIEGTDPGAPTMCYLGHTDVVPVNEDGWHRDPFGGELVDGEVWGRGAVDMLNLTAAMSLAFARLVREGFRPRGTLVLAAVADEEALGSHGAGWLTEHALEAVRSDYVITETGCMPLLLPGAKLLPVAVAEKGSYWCRLRVKGQPSHASMPFRTDNALVTAAEVVRRLAEYAPPAFIDETWRRFVEAAGLPDEVSAPLTDPGRIDEVLAGYPDIAIARQAHAWTHMTIAPTVVQGGKKINIIPDTVDLDLDIRTLPGWGEDDVREMLGAALGDLAGKVEILEGHDDPSTASEIDTPVYSAMEELAKRFHPDGTVVPTLMVGATDARFFRRKGAQSYGFGMFSNRIGYERFMAMFHGDDERIDVESLSWSLATFEQLARDVLAG